MRNNNPPVVYHLNFQANLDLSSLFRFAIFLIAVAYILRFLNAGNSFTGPRPSPSALETCGINTRLTDKAYHILEGVVDGPETIIFDASGRLVTFTGTGSIIAVNPDNSIEEIVFTGGRPLSGIFDSRGNLLIADCIHGLLELEKESGKLVTLTTHVTSSETFVQTENALRYVDDLFLSKDEKKIYFSDATQSGAPLEFGESVTQNRKRTRFNEEKGSIQTALEGRRDGRLLVFDRETRKTTVLIEDLFFGNGVALSQDESFVLVCETLQSRILRYWLKGPKQGEVDVFIDNLCGYPDSLDRSESDPSTFWVPIVAPPNNLVTWVIPHTFLRNLISLVPDPLKPAPHAYGLFLRVSETGEIIDTFHDPSGVVVSGVTSVTEHEGKLYLGNLHHHHISVYPLSEE